MPFGVNDEVIDGGGFGKNDEVIGPGSIQKLNPTFGERLRAMVPTARAAIGTVLPAIAPGPSPSLLNAGFGPVFSQPPDTRTPEEKIQQEEYNRWAARHEARGGATERTLAPVPNLGTVPQFTAPQRDTSQPLPGIPAAVGVANVLGEQANVKNAALLGAAVLNPYLGLLIGGYYGGKTIAGLGKDIYEFGKFPVITQRPEEVEQTVAQKVTEGLMGAGAIAGVAGELSRPRPMTPLPPESPALPRVAAPKQLGYPRVFGMGDEVIGPERQLQAPKEPKQLVEGPITFRTGVDPNDLRPAVRVAGRLLIGERGETHADVLTRNGYDKDAVVHEDPNRGFVNVKEPDKFLSRTEAGKGSAFNGGMDSTDLPGYGTAKLLRESGMTTAEVEKELGGPKNAIRELRTDQISGEAPSRDLSKVGQEVREGTGAQGEVQTTGQGQGVVGFTQKGANIKQLIATYTGRGGKREAVIPGSIEKMHPDDLRQVYQQLESLHKERTKGGVATEKGQEALTQEGALWSEIRNRLFRVGLRQGENVAKFSLDELQRVKSELERSLEQKQAPYVEQQFRQSLLKVNDLIQKAQPKGGKLYGGLPIFDPDLWKGAKELFDKASTIGVNRQRASALLDAADAKAKLSGREKGNRIKIALPNEVDQNALTFLAEAGGDKAKLNTFASQVSGKNKVAEVAIAKAISDFDRLQPHAKALADQLEQQRQRENKADVATDFIANYMKHALETEDTGLFDPGPSGQGVSTSFLKPRSYPNYATAIQKGEKPKTLNAAKLLESRVAAGEKLINRQAWIDQLKQLQTTTGEPFATDLVKRKGKGLTAPEGYVTKELAPGVKAAIHKEYEGLINALTGDSFVKNSTVGSILLGVEGGLKHGLLLFDSYHAFRMMRKELFQIGKIAYNKGVSLLEYDKPTIQRLVQSGDIEPKMAKWIEDNRAKKDLLVANGLNVGRIAEALFENKIRKELKVAGVDVNIPGRFNRWVFEKVTRGAMLEAGLREFDRTKKMHPEWSDDQVAAHVAKQENVYFGNLQRQGILKSQSARDVAQIVFLAPQWVESMVQTEARGAKQIMTAPFDSVMKRRLMLGSIGKGVGAGVIAYFVANQIINIMSQGQPTWENEDGHKLDAKLPGGYWLSPMNDVAEITHDFIRYGKQGKGPIESTAQIIGNKMSPLGRAAQTAFQGRDYSGVKLSDTGRLKEAAKSLIPTPLPLAGLQSEVPKQTGRQLYSTFGLKVEPDLHPHQDAVEKAGGKKVSEMDLGERFISEFEAAKGKKKLTPEQEAHAAEVSRLNIGKRGTELQGQLDKADRQWLQSRKLSLPGFDNKIKSGGTSVYLTEAETKRMSQLMLENYKAVMPILREQYDDLDEPEEKQALFSEATKAARQLARDQMLEEMSNSKNESNKKGKFQLFK